MTYDNHSVLVYHNRLHKSVLTYGFGNVRNLRCVMLFRIGGIRTYAVKFALDYVHSNVLRHVLYINFVCDASFPCQRVIIHLGQMLHRPCGAHAVPHKCGGMVFVRFARKVFHQMPQG